MTLLVVTPWPLRSRGGGQRLAREIAAALAAHHGWRICVAAGTGPPGTAPVPVETGDSIEEVRLRPVEESKARWWGRPHQVRWTPCLAELEPLVERVEPDVILYAHHYSPGAEQAAAIAAQRRIPFAFLPAIHLDHPRHIDRAAQRCYRSADLVLCLSDAEQQWLLRQARVAPDQAVMLTCGWQRVEALPAEPRADAIRLLTVGAFAPHKQVDHQLRAMAQFRDATGQRARLIAAGTLTEASTLDRLRRLTRDLGLERDVEFQPDRTDADLRRLYRNSDYFLFASRSESLGLAVLDAIGFGLMPVVYPHPAYGQLVSSSGFGVVASRATPASLAGALRLADASAVARDDHNRLNWLRQRSWTLTSAPLATALARLTEDGSRT